MFRVVFMLALFYELYPVPFPWLGRWVLVRIAEGDGIEQPVCGRQVQHVPQFVSALRVDEPAQPAQTAGTDSHGVCRQHHVTPEQSAVDL